MERKLAKLRMGVPVVPLREQRGVACALDGGAGAFFVDAVAPQQGRMSEGDDNPSRVIDASGDNAQVLLKYYTRIAHSEAKKWMTKQLATGHWKCR